MHGRRGRVECKTYATMEPLCARSRHLNFTETSQEHKSHASSGVLARFANLPHFLYNCLHMLRQSIEGRLNVRATGSMDKSTVFDLNRPGCLRMMRLQMPFKCSNRQRTDTVPPSDSLASSCCTGDKECNRCNF